MRRTYLLQGQFGPAAGLCRHRYLEVQVVGLTGQVHGLPVASKLVLQVVQGLVQGEQHTSFLYSFNIGQLLKIKDRPRSQIIGPLHDMPCVRVTVPGNPPLMLADLPARHVPGPALHLLQPGPLIPHLTRGVETAGCQRTYIIYSIVV